MVWLRIFDLGDHLTVAQLEKSALPPLSKWLDQILSDNKTLCHHASLQATAKNFLIYQFPIVTLSLTTVISVKCYRSLF